MEIKGDTRKRGTIFGKIKVGEVFLDGGDVMMKCSEAFINGNSEKANACSLLVSRLYFIPSDRKVSPINAHLTIE